MAPLHVFFLQFTLSHAVLIVLAVLFVWPRLVRMPVERAAIWLLVPFLFRHIGATTHVVGVVSADYSARAAWIVTLGDVASVVLALASILALHRRSRLGWPLVWVFTLENLGYCLALLLLEGFDALIHGIGAHWYVGTFYVLLMLVSQGVLIAVMLRRSGWPAPADSGGGDERRVRSSGSRPAR